MSARVGLLTAGVVAYLALTATLFHLDFAHRDLWWLGSAAVLFAASVLALRGSQLSSRASAAVVVGAGGLLQLVAVTRRPLTSDDFYRYVWDAKVQLSGIDPYRYPPSAPQLSHLRDSFLFGAKGCAHVFIGGCTAINRPDVHTVYPPVAQAGFVLLRVFSFGGSLSYQIFAALGVTAVTVLLLRRALRRGTAMWPVALWAWCPIVVSEFGNNAHVDWLAVLFVVLALQAAASRRDGAAAAWLGAAIATKLYPALLLPSFMRRRPWLVPVVAVGTVLLSYLPHVIAVGGGVIGYLPGYLHEEGYNSGSRLLLLGAVLPHPIDTIVGGLLLAAVALWAWRRSDPAVPEQTATIMTGAAFLVTTPAYGWYAALLVVLAVMSARYEWIILALAPSVVYLIRADVTHSSAAGSLTYLVAALLTAAAGWVPARRRTASLRRSQPPTHAGQRTGRKVAVAEARA